MTQMTADTLLTAIENETAITADDFQHRVATAARMSWCDLAYKARFEDAADQVWSVVDDITQALGVDDAREAALAVLDVVEESGQLDDTQEGELEDLREWIQQHGARFNFKRSLS